MKRTRLALLFALLSLTAGCTSLWWGSTELGRQGSSSSLVDFLYPDGSVPEAPPDALPYLELPLSVGIAFVPGNAGLALPATEQQALLERVAAAFRDRPYVASIEVIPDSYLRTARGRSGMQQVARLFGVDAMALVSWDQVAITGERESALLYWTVVGALVVKGNVNEVQTLVDTAVFDVDSTKLLFRAPGTHAGAGNATFVDAERDLRGLQSDGFSAATDTMIVNLNHELEHFREDVKRGDAARVAWRDGHGGGGTGFGLLLLAAVARRLRQYNSRV